MTRALFLIGQIGAGKTTVARGVARTTGAAVVDLGGSRDSLAQIRAHLRALPGKELVVECSGAASNFEAVLEMFDPSITVTVVKLLCPLEVALERLASSGRKEPRAGGSWEPHMRWTYERLRAVPADATFDTQAIDINELISHVISQWDRTPPRKVATGNFSFSALAFWERCPLAYRYKFIEGRAGRFPRAEALVGSATHKVLSWLYEHESDSPTSADLLVQFRRTLSEVISSPVERLAESVSEAETALLRHFDLYRLRRDRTIGTEVPFRLDLAQGFSYSGAIDRVCESPGGWTCAIDYKLRARPPLLSSNVPDMLQLEAYGVAVLERFHQSAVETRRHLLSTGEEEVRRLTREDIPRIASAIRRWAGRLVSDHDYLARPTKLCYWCQYRAICPTPFSELHGQN